MVAATRERTLSLRSRLRIWTFTVCSEIFNTEAICLFDSPLCQLVQNIQLAFCQHAEGVFFRAKHFTFT